MEIISCTEAGNILELSKEQVRDSVRQNKLNNYGNEKRFMVSENEVRDFKCK